MGNDSESNSNATGEAPEMPAEVKLIVQHLKEIVDNNFTDSEIYAVLTECNMDPNEAVQQLLSQDSFKPVKNKRDRRKKMKDTKESRAQCNSGTANCGFTFGREHAAGQTGSENNYNELRKNAYKREMVSATPSISAQSSYTGKVVNEPPSAHSEFLNVDNRRQSIGTGDIMFPSMQSSLGLQPAWPGVSRGHVSTANIAKGGGPENKGSQMSSEISCTSQSAVLPNSSCHHNRISPQDLSSPESELHQDSYSSQPSSFSEMIHGPGMTDGQHNLGNEGNVIEHIAAVTGSLVTDAISAASDAEVYSNHTCLYSDSAEFSRYSHSDDVQIPGRDFDGQNQISDEKESASASSRQTFANRAGRASDDDLLKATSSFDSYGHVSKHQEGIGNLAYLSFPHSSASLNDDVISMLSAMANLQQLDIGKEEPVMPPTDGHSAVGLPNHLQAFAADCSHLSFGTYKSGVASASPMAVASNPTESNLEISAADGSSAVHSHCRNSEDCDDDHRGFTYDTERVPTDARNYDPTVSSQSEMMKQDLSETTRGHQYVSPLSVPDSSIENIQQSGSNFPFAVDLNARNFSSLASETHPESTPSDLLALHRQSLRMTDPSPFFAMQLVPSGNASAVSSIDNNTVPMPEVSNSGSPLPRLSPHMLPGSNLSSRTVLPQCQPVHSHSQPTLPVGDLANMIVYPSMAQSQAYVPSALQQVYAESRFHDSLARRNYNLLQHRNSATMGGLPLSYYSPSAYGNFVGSAAEIPESFPRNPHTSHMGRAVGYDGLHSRYQRNNRSSTRDSGVGPQTMSMPSDVAYYSMLGQNQHRAGYQQDQQASQHYESLGYPNTYLSGRITRPSRGGPW